MTVAELEKELASFPKKDARVFLAADAEGNGYQPLVVVVDGNESDEDYDIKDGDVILWP